MADEKLLPLYRIRLRRNYTNSEHVTISLLRADGFFAAERAGEAEAVRWNENDPLGPRWKFKDALFVDERKLAAGEVFCID